MPVLAFLLGVLAGQPAPTAGDAAVPLLVVLAPTSDTRDGLPVLTRHPDGAAHEAVLLTGFSGRLVRLFRREQQWLNQRDGRPVEPAYLLLSTNQGGFPRFGFWLDDDRKEDVGYVDLHERSSLTGRFGALDQIFPHELLHVIVRQLTGPPPSGSGGANQVHAIGVRTDRVTAFNEGFAESVQVLAVDDPDAHPETRALALDPRPPARAAARLAWYERALTARWSPAPPARMGFVFWFGQTEQALRYHAVKANAFAREPLIPPRLLGRRDRYPAYLLDNMLPGASDTPAKSTPRLFATESVVAALFSRWVVDPVLQQPAGDMGLHGRFGASGGELSPVEHAYLKLFSVLAADRPHDAEALLHAYVRAFPDETEAVGRLVQDLGFEWPLADAPELWLANRSFQTGTTLFDQYRGVPRVHTFDLNAASVVDLLTVDGVSPDLARDVLASGPYSSVTELSAVPGMSELVIARFRDMEVAMAELREANARGDGESLSLVRIFTPLLVRASLWILAAAVAAAWLYRRMRFVTRWRAALNGVAAASVGLLGTWVLGAALETESRGLVMTVLPFVPCVVFGLAGAGWQLLWHRRAREAGAVVIAWALACVPALVVTASLG